jgi:hypothetical protein
MKKHLIVIGMTLMLLAVGLSGCVEQDISDKIIGVWEFEQTGIMINYQFFKNGNLTIIALIDAPENITTVIGEYVITTDNISMRYPLNIPGEKPTPILFNYTFFDNDNKLELIDVGYKQKIILTKI